MISNFSCASRPAYSLEGFHGNGFRIVRGMYSYENSAGKSHPHYIVQLNDGAPFSYSLQSQGKMTSDICDSRNIVKLLSRGAEDQLKCIGEYFAIEVSFEKHFIDKILEKENFTFGECYNFHDPLLNSLITELYNSACLKTTENLYIESLAIVCVIHLATTYTVSNKRIFSLKGKLSSHQLQRVIAFTRETINRTVTLEELARCCHLSVFHFSRLFKNTLGISPYQYVLRTKIDYARTLIKGKKPIGEVAYSLGFTDSAHFCNAFKRFTGHSPLQYVAVMQRLRVSTQYPISRMVPVS